MQTPSRDAPPRNSLPKNTLPRNTLRWAAWVVILWGVTQAKSFLIPLFLASLLAFLMAPVVNQLRKKKLPEWAALTLSSILLFLPVFGIIILLFNEGAILLRDYPHLLASLKEHWLRLGSSSFIQNFHLSEYLDISYLGERLGEEAGKGLSLFLDGLKAIAEAGAHLFVILFFSIVMLASRFQLRKSAEKLLSNTRTLDEIIQLIEKFLLARIGIALFVACLDAIILKLLGSHYSVLLGCLLGLSTLIPIVGFLIAILPPIALSIAMGHSMAKTGLTILLLYLVSTTEIHWVTPKYLGRQLNLNLLATFIGLFGGEMLWGIWGVVLSIPLLGILRIILEASKDLQPWAVLLAEKDSYAGKKRSLETS